MELLMSSAGIRIHDLKDGKCISLSEILESIPKDYQLNWALLWLEVSINTGESLLITGLQQEINHSKNGLLYSFTNLSELSKKIYQEINLLIISSKDPSKLHRYKNDQEMYEVCEIVIEMIDGGYGFVAQFQPSAGSGLMAA